MSWKNRLLWVLVVSISTNLAAEEPQNRAQPGDTSQDRSPDRQARLRRILQQFDRNGDGRLDKAERAAARKAMQDRVPAGTGKARSKKGTTDKKRPQAARGPFYERLLKQFDANRNGRLDPAEIARARQTMGDDKKGRNQRSTDNRKRPNRQTDKAGPDQMSRMRQVMQRFDANKNGRLDPDELAKLRQMNPRNSGRGRAAGRLGPPAPERANRVDQTELLKRFDANNNGKLDGAERQKAIEAIRG